ncbi:unnamed protein product [Rotaria sp. Silwood1]|nr:unnamed protein product [Rotaria sp. Silwood1]
MPLVSLFDRSLPTSSSFKQSTNIHTTQPCILSDPNVNGAAKENGCESSFAKHQQQHHHHHHQRNNNSFSMSAATASCSSFQPHVVSEESYCSPWDLKIQEEKFKLLSEQRSTSSSNTITALTDALLHPSNTNHRSTSSSSSSSNNNNAFHRTRSARTTSSTKISLTLREPSPPLLPPLPPGGLIPPPSTTTNVTCQCGSNNNTRNRSLNNNNNNNSINESLDPSLKKISYCLNAHAIRSGTDTSRSFVFASSSPSNERSQRVNTAPAKVDLSHVIENRQESTNIMTQNSTISSSSSSTESPLLTDDTKPMSFEAALQRFKRLSSSTRCNNTNNSASSLCKTQNTTNQESPIAYERPWDTLQTSLINSLSSPPSSGNSRNGEGSLQKMFNTEESKQHCLPPFPMVSPTITTCRHSTCSPDDKHNISNTNIGEICKTNNRNLAPSTSDIDMTIPIDRYFWYHYAMSRRTAENILQTRPPGSFLVRQSESGNQNDYSLSIRTAKSCMHMRICYSTGVYILGECSRPFPSVSRMIEYFSQTSVPIRGAAPIKLGTPVFRCETLTSSPNNHHCNEGNEELL